MKRIEFYSLHRPDGEPLQAVRHTGYTDGNLNFYRGHPSWVAVDPHTGLAIAFAGTRKECIQKAYDATTLAKFNLFKDSAAYLRLTEEFTRLRNAQRLNPFGEVTG